MLYWFERSFQPFNATRINASAINERVNVLEKENGSQGSGKAGFWEEFEVCGAQLLVVSMSCCHRYPRHHNCRHLSLNSCLCSL